MRANSEIRIALVLISRAAAIVRIITILQDDDFWRVPECIRHHDEISVGGYDREAVPFGVIPNLAIRVPKLKPT